jgi:hypothetical protein
MQRILLRFVVIVSCVIGLTVASDYSPFRSAGEPCVLVAAQEQEASVAADGIIVLMLDSTGWDQERFTVPPGTYELQVDDSAGNQTPFTVKARLSKPDGTSRIILREPISAGQRVTQTVKLHAGSKVVVRIVERKDLGKAVITTAAS